MEHTEPHCLSHRIILHKNRKGQHGSRTLNAKCHHQHYFQQPQNALKAGLVQRFLDQRSFPNADLLAGQQNDAYTQRGDPHATDLDQQQEDCLSESGKHCITLNRGKTSDAHAACGSEQGIDKRQRLPRLVRDRQHQQARSQ